MLLIETKDDIIPVIEQMLDRNPPVTGNYVLFQMTDSINRTFHKGVTFDNPQEFFISFGAIVVSMLKDKKGFDIGTFADFLLRKHSAYGSAPILRWGVLGVFIRIDSKVVRIANLTQQLRDEECGESIHDTLLDLLGYCVLGYQLVTKQGV